MQQTLKNLKEWFKEVYPASDKEDTSEVDWDQDPRFDELGKQKRRNECPQSPRSCIRCTPM